MKLKYLLNPASILLSIIALSSCGGGGSSDTTNNSNTTSTPTAPSTTLVFTLNNFSTQLVQGINYYDENNAIQQLNFTSALNPLDTGTIQIDVTAGCDYDIDFGLTYIFPVYNLGGGSLFADILSQELIMFNCRATVPVINITCNLVNDSAETSGYNLTCTDTFNNV